MIKIVFLLADQGAQKLGMASDLRGKHPTIKETSRQASNILGYDIRELIDDEENKLSQTRYTQPTILTISVAIFRLLQEREYRPDVVAGLSLDGYSALVASGALGFKDAVAPTVKRGESMEAVAPAGTGRIVAIMNTETSSIEEICQKASSKGIVTPTNYNTSAQIVIGGETEAVSYVAESLKEAGVKRLAPLKVSGSFHIALLRPASECLTEVLDKVIFSEFQVSLIGDTEAEVTDHADIKALFVKQAREPVRLYDSIETMRELGVTEITEISSGKVLSEFLRKADRVTPTSTAEDEASSETLLEK